MRWTLRARQSSRWLILYSCPQYLHVLFDYVRLLTSHTPSPVPILPARTVAFYVGTVLSDQLQHGGRCPAYLC